MSSNLENNKIFAAILVAGIVAMLSAFVAEILTETHELEKDAITIEGAPEETAAGGAPAGPQPILALIAAADAAQGEKLSKACAACHTFSPGEPAKVGPNLAGIINAKYGHMAGFAYSDAMLASKGTWTYSDLNHFLWSPKKFLPGTKMTYAGMKKPEERAALIAWLRSISGNPALPSAADIKAEEAELAPPAPAAAPVEGAPADGAKPAEEKPAEKPAH